LIVNPKNWGYICEVPTIKEIEETMREAVANTNCPNLCLSGGVDSSLTLHFMSSIFPKVNCFTIAQSENHPDYYYSKLIASKYKTNHFLLVPNKHDIKAEMKKEDAPGDVAVRLLFKFIGNYTNSVITTDCIDELACGYYRHEEFPTDETFRELLSELEKSHLEPLHKNSGDVAVHVPYATQKIIHLFLRIPLKDKIRKRHIMSIASKYIPEEIVNRRKYGFCAALDNIEVQYGI